MPIPLSIIIYERGTAGVPTTTYVTSLQQAIDSYEHTISDRYGFESMAVSLACTIDEAIAWLTAGLMRSVVVTSPDGETCWEGLLSSVVATIGQKKASVSLERMANRVRCKYTTVLGTPGTTSTVSATVSQALYGIKDYVVTLDNDTATAAANKAARVLAELALPRSAEPSDATTGAAGDIRLDLSFAGWYTSLDWVLFGRSSTTTTTTTTQVGTLIGTVAPGIGATNAFLSTSTADIVNSGSSATEYAEPETTYRQKIEALLSQGNSTGARLTWGVYEGRIFRVAVWAGATPGATTYREVAGDPNIYDTYGAVVAPWNVRPNAMSEITTLLDAGPVTGAVDAAARKYVGRVTCSISGDQVGCTLEPSETSGIDALLATFGRR